MATSKACTKCPWTTPSLSQRQAAAPMHILKTARSPSSRHLETTARCSCAPVTAETRRNSNVPSNSEVDALAFMHLGIVYLPEQTSTSASLESWPSSTRIKGQQNPGLSRKIHADNGSCHSELPYMPAMGRAPGLTPISSMDISLDDSFLMDQELAAMLRRGTEEPSMRSMGLPHAPPAMRAAAAQSNVAPALQALSSLDDDFKDVMAQGDFNILLGGNHTILPNSINSMANQDMKSNAGSTSSAPNPSILPSSTPILPDTSARSDLPVMPSVEQMVSTSSHTTYTTVGPPLHWLAVGVQQMVGIAAAAVAQHPQPSAWIWRAHPQQQQQQQQQVSAASQAADIQSEVESLRAEVARLRGEKGAAEARAAAAQKRVAWLQGMLRRLRPMLLMARAVESMQQRLLGVQTPQELEPVLMDREDGAAGGQGTIEDDLLGAGGYGRVYSRVLAGQRVAVKMEVMHRQACSPRRCAELLPSLLPPHPAVMRPLTWTARSVQPAAPMPDVEMPVEEEECGGGGAGAAGRPGVADGMTGKGVQHMQLLTVWQQKDSDLQAHVKRVGCLDLESQLVVVRDLASAVAHLQRHRVVHCDVKPANVLLDVDPASGRVSRAYLADFGLAQVLLPGTESVACRCGTWKYSAPEQTGPEGCINLHTDTWGLGLITCFTARASLRVRSGSYSGSDAATAVAKSGTCPESGRPFVILWEDILPQVDAATVPLRAGGEETAARAALRQAYRAAQQVLREVAEGCMIAAEPRERCLPSEVLERVDAVLLELRQAAAAVAAAAAAA